LDIREGLASDFNQGMNNYLQLRQNGKDIYDFSSKPLDLIGTGKYRMRRQKFDDAIAMFEASTTFFISLRQVLYLRADCGLLVDERKPRDDRFLL
jgi:hypothetical protein